MASQLSLSAALAERCQGSQCAKSEGLYVGRQSGQPLFREADRITQAGNKASFIRPIRRDYLIEDGLSAGGQSAPVRDAATRQPVGHVVHDGTPPFGKRYVIARESLSFRREALAQAPEMTAFFAARCAWRSAASLQRIPGVIAVRRGRQPGARGNAMGGVPSVEVRYDPSRARYADLAARFQAAITQDAAGGGTGRPVFFVTDPSQARVLHRRSPFAGRSPDVRPAGRFVAARSGARAPTSCNPYANGP